MAKEERQLEKEEGGETKKRQKLPEKDQVFCVYQQLVSRVLLDETLTTAAQPKIRKLINKNRKQIKIYVYKSL